MDSFDGKNNLKEQFLNCFAMCYGNKMNPNYISTFENEDMNNL